MNRLRLVAAIGLMLLATAAPFAAQAAFVSTPGREALVPKASAFDAQIQSLKNQMGLAVQVNETEREGTDGRWYSGKGLLSAKAADLNADGQDELLVAYIAEGGSSGRSLHLRVYASRAGSVVRLGDVKLDEYFAWDSADIEVALVTKGGKTYIFYQGLLGSDPEWSGYFVFNVKDDKIGTVYALRDAPYTAVTILEKMNALRPVSTLDAYYDWNLRGKLLFRVDGRDHRSGKYKSYRAAVAGELKPYGLTSFGKDYRPRVKTTSNMTKICSIHYGYDAALRGVTRVVVDHTGLQGAPLVNPDIPPVAVAKVTLNEKKASLNAGKTLQLKAAVSPSNATNKNLSWTSDNDAVATVDSNGLVTGVGKGVTYVRATAANKTSTACKVTVSWPRVKKVIFSWNYVVISPYEEEKKRLDFTVEPALADKRTIKFSSSNKRIVRVSSSGVLTPVRFGTVVITAKGPGNKVLGRCKVCVEQD